MKDSIKMKAAKTVPFQEIFDVLQTILPDKWKKVIMYIEYGDSSFSMKYFYTEDGKRYVDCFDQPGLSVNKRREAFINIDKIIDGYRKALSDKELWTVLTLIIDDKGHFKCNYDYSAIKDTVEYQRKWKKKYIIEQK